MPAKYGMDPKKFLERLTELTEWHRPMVGPNGSASVKKRGRPPEDPQELEEYLEEQQRIKLAESQPNSTVHPVVKKIKYPPKKCDGCDRILEEAHRIEKKQFISGRPHWRERCVNCNCYRSPLTDQFDIPARTAHEFFLSYYREKKGVYQSKYQPNIPPRQPKPKPTPRPIGRPRKYQETDMGDNLIRRFESEK